MKVEFRGTAGGRGWPEPGCPCASCGRLAPGHRRPLAVLVDGEPVEVGDVEMGAGTGGDGGQRRDGECRVRDTPHGLEVVARDGHRLLHAVTTSPLPTGTGEPPYDVVLIDLLEAPARLGALRRTGLAGPRTRVVALPLDHRAGTEEELARRLASWGALAVPDGTVLDTDGPPPPLSPVPRRTLLLGGSRSGKSAEAESRLMGEPYVTYAATGPSGGDDPEWRARVEAHRRRRPAHWDTVETTDLAGLLRRADVPLLVDGIGTWLAAAFDECRAWEEPATGVAAVEERCDELVAAWRGTAARVVAVSDEVGMGVVPATRSGRVFRDALGRLNQRLAAESEETALVVAGRLFTAH